MFSVRLYAKKILILILKGPVGKARVGSGTIILATLARLQQSRNYIKQIPKQNMHLNNKCYESLKEMIYSFHNIKSKFLGLYRF